MPTLYLETSPLGNNRFEFIQTRYIGLSADAEKVIEWEAPDRLTAAIINLGLACRDLFDNYQGWANSIFIESDTDGLDHKYGNEHNIMFALLFPDNGNQAKKQSKLYAEYDRHFERLWYLIKQGRIEIKLVDRHNPFGLSEEK